MTARRSSSLRPNVKFHNGQTHFGRRALQLRAAARSVDHVAPHLGSEGPRRLASACRHASNVTGLSPRCHDREDHPYRTVLALPEPAHDAIVLHSALGSAAEIASKRFFENPPEPALSRWSPRARQLCQTSPRFPNISGRSPGRVWNCIIPESLKAEMEFESGNLDLLQLHPRTTSGSRQPEHASRIHDVPR